MSRGIGSTQKRVLAVLHEGPVNEGLPVGKLKALVGGDRANTRRAIRTLKLRGLAEEAAVGGEQRIRLTFWGGLKAMPPLPKQPDPLAELRAKWKAEDRERALRKEHARPEAAEVPARPYHERYSVRRRQLGPTQELVLAILWEYADPMNEGLPVSTVKAIVGSDRANTRRAIRTLLLRGELDQSEDGLRIRLASGTALLFTIIPPIPPEAIDEGRARSILRANGDR